MVAKSYQKYHTIDLPYQLNGKWYVNIDVNGQAKKVRWYDEKEYAKMYPEDNKVDKSKDPYYKSQKEVLGFEKGYITIFKGVKESDDLWFRQNEYCRYARHWGWYVPSGVAVPMDYPKGIQTVKLMWEGMGNDERLLDEKTVKDHVEKTLAGGVDRYEGLRYLGNVGDRLLINHLKVVGKSDVKSNYGKCYIYEMVDNLGVRYKWKTGAKDWSVGTAHSIRGTIKAFCDVNGNPGIELTRCYENV